MRPPKYKALESKGHTVAEARVPWPVLPKAECQGLLWLAPTQILRPLQKCLPGMHIKEMLLSLNTQGHREEQVRASCSKP